MMQPKSPKMKTKEFFTNLLLKPTEQFQFEARSIKAGAMRLKVDILTAPSSDTKRSSQGTVAARATENRISIRLSLYSNKRGYCEIYTKAISWKGGQECKNTFACHLPKCKEKTSYYNIICYRDVIPYVTY